MNFTKYIIFVPIIIIIIIIIAYILYQNHSAKKLYHPNSTHYMPQIIPNKTYNLIPNYKLQYNRYNADYLPYESAIPAIDVIRANTNIIQSSYNKQNIEYGQYI